MILITDNEEMGRLEALIRLAAKEGHSQIVCASNKRAKSIIYRAGELGIEITQPITYEGFRDRSALMGNNRSIYIDDLENFLSYLGYQNPINAATIPSRFIPISAAHEKQIELMQVEIETLEEEIEELKEKIV